MFLGVFLHNEVSERLTVLGVSGGIRTHIARRRQFYRLPDVPIRHHLQIKRETICKETVVESDLSQIV